MSDFIPGTLKGSQLAKFTGLNRYEVYRLLRDDPKFCACVLYRTPRLIRFSSQRLIEAGYLVRTETVTP